MRTDAELIQQYQEGQNAAFDELAKRYLQDIFRFFNAMVQNEEDAEDLGKRFLKGDFSLLDLYEQMQAMKKMGPLTKVVEMIPGFGQLKLPKEALQTQEGKLEKWKISMQSMTQEELEDPESIDSERIDRISKGSGLGAGSVRELIKQYRQSKKMIKMMKGSGDMNKMMKKFKGRMPKGRGM